MNQPHPEIMDYWEHGELLHTSSDATEQQNVDHRR